MQNLGAKKCIMGNVKIANVEQNVSLPGVKGVNGVDLEVCYSVFH